MAYKQIGIQAMRAPNGEFLPAVPIFAEVEVNAEGATETEERAADWFAQLAIKMIRDYKAGCREAEQQGLARVLSSDGD